MVFLCSAVFAAGCAGNAGEYVLTGKFENAAASYAMIKCGKTVEDMDTIRLSADGSFRYVRKLEKPAISFMMVPETGFFSVIMINRIMPLSRRPNLPLRISASVRKNVWLTSLIPLSAAWRSANWMLLLS